MSVGEYACNSRTTSEGSESTLLAALLYSPSVIELMLKQTFPVKFRETQSSFEVDNVVS